MRVRELRDRRGRSVRGSLGLLERDDALRAIEVVIDAAQEGTGQALLIEGHAGMGKSRLHEAGLDLARARGMRVLRTAGAELERSIAFGVAAQLMQAQLIDMPAGRRRSLLASAPERVRALAGIEEEPADAGAGDDLALSHSLFTLLATADERRPALVAIDDLHWCDRASLEFVLYMLHRLEELPIAVLMTRRPGIGEGDSDVLDRIAVHPSVRIETLSPLGPDAVGELTRRMLGDRADATVIDACYQATAGNPFYLHTLLLALREEHTLSSDQLARRARALAPDAVTRTLRVRVGRVGPAGAALARAIAILGDDVPLRHAATLASLRLRAASAAADALAAVEVVLAREPLRFVHPLVRRAIENDIPASERASRHLDAARLLFGDGVDAERIAAHLLLGRAEGDAWVVQQLRTAARAARARAAPQPAVEYLQRALDEPPVADLRVAVLAELGAAEAAAGMPAAAEHLADAVLGSSDPIRRAELQLQRGHALDEQGTHEQAAEAFDAGLDQLKADPSEPELLELHDALQTGFVATASLVPALQQRASERSRKLLNRDIGAPRTQGQRMLLAQAAAQSAWAGERSEQTAELALRSWDEGRLLEVETADGIAWSLVTGALTLSGELERSVEVADAVLEDARRRGSPLAFATASYCRSVPYLWQGRVTDALADLEPAREARRYGWRRFARAAAAVHALCLIEIGELERAEDALAGEGPLDRPRDLEDVARLSARAELRLAQGDPAHALADALAAAKAIGPTIKAMGYSAWRSTAALSALALGDRPRALELAHDEFQSADEIGVLHARIRATRVLGLCQQGDQGLETLRAATELAAQGRTRLETIRALFDLGAALRRANHRSAARDPLGQAADDALRGGASVLHERARTELVATGARPRRVTLLSGPASLTPSERRIADLAATGRSNRDIAQALFVTPKTVEYHLRHAYRKLDIGSRRELREALSPAE
jgi:DNA-binding CsgD family transcriptional regulator